MSGSGGCSQITAEVLATTRPKTRGSRFAERAFAAMAFHLPIEGAMKEMEEGNKRTLQRDHTILKEFDDGTDPGLLALYYHKRDMAFDAFNATEYTKQMENYYANDIRVKLVLPRKIGENKLSLVCLQNIQPEKDTLCDLAFQAMRQFVGHCMLVKHRCFVCNSPNAVKACGSCKCAFYCSRECQQKDWPSHKKLCKLIKESNVTLESECVQLKPEHADYPKPE